MPRSCRITSSGGRKMTNPDIAQRLQETLPDGVRRLLNLVTGTAAANNIPLYIVGGFVRDLLLGKPHLDLDFVVERSGIAFANLLKAQYGGEVETHPAFGTARWHLNTDIAHAAGADFNAWPPYVDLVTARRETYAHPGALPDVVPSTIRDDLFRRDFTINAMAIPLVPAGPLLDPFGGGDDL